MIKLRGVKSVADSVIFYEDSVDSHYDSKKQNLSLDNGFFYRKDKTKFRLDRVRSFNGSSSSISS